MYSWSYRKRQHVNKWLLLSCGGWISSINLSGSERQCARDSQYTSHIISYTFFADVDTGIYPHTASQYHAQPNAKHGIAMLSVDKFPYRLKQTKGNKFIPCSNNLCHTLKCFCSFKSPDIPFILPKSSYKFSVDQSHGCCKRSGRWPWSLCDCHCDVIMMFPSLYISHWWSQTLSILDGY